jgi:hypothetical protein
MLFLDYLNGLAVGIGWIVLGFSFLTTLWILYTLVRTFFYAIYVMYFLVKGSGVEKIKSFLNYPWYLTKVFCTQYKSIYMGDCEFRIQDPLKTIKFSGGRLVRSK